MKKIFFALAMLFAISAHAVSGEVKMYRTTDSANNGTPATWVVEKPDGTFLDISTSLSSGFQEAINYAAQNGYDFHKFGGGIASKNGQDTSILYLNYPVTIPPLQGTKWIIDGTINFGSAPSGTPAAITFDSMMSTQIIWTGQIVTNAYWGAGVKFSPTNLLPQDQGAGAVITSSRVWLPSVSMSGSGICIILDTSSHPIMDNEFRFIEPNNNGIANSVGVKVFAGTGFINNQISVIGAHGATVSEIDNGNSSALPGASNLYGNQWYVSMNPASGAIGLNDYSWQDGFTLSITGLEGTPATGIVAPSGIPSSTWRYAVLRNSATTQFANR